MTAGTENNPIAIAVRWKRDFAPLFDLPAAHPEHRLAVAWCQHFVPARAENFLGFYEYRHRDLEWQSSTTARTERLSSLGYALFCIGVDILYPLAQARGGYWQGRTKTERRQSRIVSRKQWLDRIVEYEPKCRAKLQQCRQLATEAAAVANDELMVQRAATAIELIRLMRRVLGPRQSSETRRKAWAVLVARGERAMCST